MVLFRTRSTLAERNNQETIFLPLDAGYKINQRTGLHINYKPRVSGSDFYATLISFGGYFYY